MMQQDSNNRMMEIVRKRILERQEEEEMRRRLQEAFDRLQGLPFAVRTPEGRLMDPWQLTEEERQLWMLQFHETMSEFREQARLVNFTKDWAGLDKEHRHQLIDEHPEFFKSARADYMKSLTDADCMWLQDLENWEVADFLTNNGPVHGMRPPLNIGGLRNEEEPSPAPASKLAA